MNALDVVVIGISIGWIAFVLNIAVRTIIDVIKEMRDE